MGPPRDPRSVLAGEPGRDRVVGLLVRARLVTSERETFEIAHEALARAWPRLRSWLDDDVAGQRIMRHLVSAADGWDTLGRPDTELYRGARLETALEWRAHASTELTALEAAFLDASAELAESERRALADRAERESRANRRLRGLLVGLGVVVVGSIVVGALAVRASRQADRASQVATARELAAAADASIEIDSERGILLALAAIERAEPVGGAVLDQAEEALHRAMAATQIEWRVTGTGAKLHTRLSGSATYDWPTLRANPVRLNQVSSPRFTTMSLSALWSTGMQMSARQAPSGLSTKSLSSVSFAGGTQRSVGSSSVRSIATVRSR